MKAMRQGRGRGVPRGASAASLFVYLPASEDSLVMHVCVRGVLCAFRCIWLRMRCVLVVACGLLARSFRNSDEAWIELRGIKIPIFVGFWSRAQTLAYYHSFPFSFWE